MAAATSSPLPDWALLDTYIFRTDGADESSFPADDSTAAACANSRGDTIPVCFKLREPPRPSLVYLRWPAGGGRSDHVLDRRGRSPRRRALPDDLPRLGARLPPPHRHVRVPPLPRRRRLLPPVAASGPLHRGHHRRLPVHDQGGALPHRRPAPAPASRLGHRRPQRRRPGLRRRGAADLRPVRRAPYGRAPRLQARPPRPVGAQAPADHLRRRREHGQDPLSVAWCQGLPLRELPLLVDYLVGGMFLSKVLDDEEDDDPMLRYLELPATIPGLHRDLQGTQFQTMAAHDNHGVLKFVMATGADGAISGDDEFCSFKVTSWTMGIHDMRWSPPATVTSDELLGPHGFETLPLNGLYHPRISMADLEMVYFFCLIEKEEMGSSRVETFRVAIDLAKKAVILSSPYVKPELDGLSVKEAQLLRESAGFFNSLVGIELPKYLKLDGTSVDLEPQWISSRGEAWEHGMNWARPM
ncbi:hypothetical protein ACP70R_003052 [Stipagrostis hirtigluma subsp. patula]